MFSIKKVFVIILILILKLNIFSIDTITIAIDEGVRPLMYGEDGVAKGLYAVLIKEVFAQIDIPVEIKPLPWKRALSYVDAGIMGVGGVYKTKKRLEKYDFSEELFKEIIVIYTLRDRNFEYNQINDLFDKKVGILRGWSYGEEFDTATFKKLIEAEEVATDEQNFLKLLRGRIDCILVVKEVAELILEDNSEFTGRVKVVKEPLIVNPTYLIFSKNSNKKELLDEFNKKLLELKENKGYLRLVKKGMIN